MDLSVIISTHNRALLLKEAVESFMNQSIQPDRYEIIVVNSYCIDNTDEIVRHLIKDNPEINLSYIQQPIVGGCTLSRHVGAKAARSDILVFGDDDIRVTEHHLESALKALEDEKVGNVAGRILPEYEVEPPSWVNTFWIWHDLGKFLLPYTLLDCGEETIEVPCLFALSPNLATRKRLFFESGGFGPDGFGGEYVRYNGSGENFLAENVSKMGYRTIYCPGMLAYHHIAPYKFTPGFFMARAFYVSIVDSFKLTRELGRPLSNLELIKRRLGIERLGAGIMKEIMRRGIKAFYCGIRGSLKLAQELRHPLSNIDGVARELVSEEAENTGYGNRLKAGMRRVRFAGFLYHQTQLRTEPTLLDFVLRENWLDFDFTSLKPDTGTDFPSLW